MTDVVVGDTLVCSRVGRFPPQVVLSVRRPRRHSCCHFLFTCAGQNFECCVFRASVTASLLQRVHSSQLGNIFCRDWILWMSKWKINYTKMWFALRSRIIGDSVNYRCRGGSGEEPDPEYFFGVLWNLGGRWETSRMFVIFTVIVYHSKQSLDTETPTSIGSLARYIILRIIRFVCSVCAATVSKGVHQAFSRLDLTLLKKKRMCNYRTLLHIFTTVRAFELGCGAAQTRV